MSANNSSDKGSGGYPMPHERTIFRSEAYRHYIENREKVVLPRLISERLFVLLWIIALLLVILGVVITFWPLIEQLR